MIFFSFHLSSSSLTRFPLQLRLLLTNEGGLDSLHPQRSPFDVAEEDLIITLAVSFSGMPAGRGRPPPPYSMRKQDLVFGNNFHGPKCRLKFCRPREMPCHRVSEGQTEETSLNWPENWGKLKRRGRLARRPREEEGNETPFPRATGGRRSLQVGLHATGFCAPPRGPTCARSGSLECVRFVGVTLYCAAANILTSRCQTDTLTRRRGWSV